MNEKSASTSVRNGMVATSTGRQGRRKDAERKTARTRTSSDEHEDEDEDKMMKVPLCPQRLRFYVTSDGGNVSARSRQFSLKFLNYLLLANQISSSCHT